MKKLILTVTILSLGIASFAQQEHSDTRPTNNIYLNLLGDASLISINYERLFLVSPKFTVSSKLGVGYNQEFQLCFGSCLASPKNYFTLPHHVTGNFGKGKHLFELGLGGTFISGDTPQPYSLYPIVGYRIQPLMPDRLTFRIFAQIPLLHPAAMEDILFSPIGLSVGVSFK